MTIGWRKRARTVGRSAALKDIVPALVRERIPNAAYAMQTSVNIQYSNEEKTSNGFWER